MSLNLPRAAGIALAAHVAVLLWATTLTPIVA